MISKQELAELIQELYPSVSYRQSCILCAKDTSCSVEAVYKMGREKSEYPVKPVFYKLLTAKKELIKLDKLKIDESYLDSREKLLQKNYKRIEEKKEYMVYTLKKIKEEIDVLNKTLSLKVEDSIQKFS
jgi:hypothetical protein